MEKFFNTSGPIDTDEHYALPPLHRVDWEEVNHLIRTKRYFVLHAPRQTGKTSTLPAIMAELNHEGRLDCEDTVGRSGCPTVRRSYGPTVGVGGVEV